MRKPLKWYKKGKTIRVNDKMQKIKYKLSEDIGKNFHKDFKPDFVYERINYLQSSGPRVCKEMGICHFAEINSPYVKEKVELEGCNSLYYT